jgi:peptidoglycan/LPS O-acetylase OafA/YrhL
MKAGFLDPPSLMGRSNGIDFLRGWFSIQVLVLGHVAFWTTIAQGRGSVPAPVKWLAGSLVSIFQSRAELNPAVLGFIVLSGFCIHRNGLRPGLPIQPFAIRRAFRILPVFLLATIAGIALFGLSTDVSQSLAASLTGTGEISTACVLAKITAVASLAPIAHPCDFAGNAPLLTVMVEIGLYGFYGTVFAVGDEFWVYCACAVSILTGLVIAALNARHPTLYNWWQNSSLLAFLPYWWIGAAAIVPRFKADLMKWWPAIATAWLLLSAIAYFLDPTAIASELRKLVFAALIACVVVKFDEMAMPANPLSFVGKAGYGVYAFHAPLAVYLILLGAPWWLTSAGAIVFGVCVYFAIERPLNLLGRHMAGAADRTPPPIEDHRIAATAKAATRSISP